MEIDFLNELLGWSKKKNYLFFRIGKEKYAIDLKYVDKVIMLEDVSKEGISIKDFGEPEVGNFVLILLMDGERFGIKVDELIDVTNIYEGNIIFLDNKSFR